MIPNFLHPQALTCTFPIPNPKFSPSTRPRVPIPDPESQILVLHPRFWSLIPNFGPSSQISVLHPPSQISPTSRDSPAHSRDKSHLGKAKIPSPLPGIPGINPIPYPINPGNVELEFPGFLEYSWVSFGIPHWECRRPWVGQFQRIRENREGFWDQRLGRKYELI